MGTVTIGDQTLIGQPGQTGPLGVSVLSPPQATGEAATVGVLSGGQVVTVGSGAGTTAATAGGRPAELIGLDLGGNQVLGQGGSALIDVGVLSDTARGTTVTGNVLSGGQTVGVGVRGSTGQGSGVSGGLVGGVVGGVLGGGQSGGSGHQAGNGGLVGGVVGGVLRPRR